MQTYTELARVDNLVKISETIDTIRKRQYRALSIETYYNYVQSQIKTLISTDEPLKCAYSAYLYASDIKSPASALIILALRSALPEEFWEIEHAHTSKDWVRYVISQEKSCNIRNVISEL